MSFLWKSDTAPNVLPLSVTTTALSEVSDKEKKKKEKSEARNFY